jgi:NAD(P)-dependent dehydrogenase (short-subunit alcohol dehydrogenase family)
MFDNKLAVVTGATGGLGEAICLALAEAGAHVLAVARGGSALRRLAARHASIEGWTADITDPEFHRALEGRAVRILVNNAGRNTPLPMAETPTQVLHDMVNLNVLAAYSTAQAAVRAMLRDRDGGSIVNITSQMGHVGAPGRTVYCMTKHAVEGLTKAMAVELGPHDIRVNSVAPTFVETPMTKPMLAEPAFRQSVMTSIPLGRLAEPKDVAHAVLFLTSPAARMITGTSLLVDGGWIAR